MKHNLIVDVNKEGKLPKNAIVKLQEIFHSLAGKKMQMEIGIFHKTRSGSQNAYYHGVVVNILGNELGYDHDEMHEVLKYKFLGIKEKEINGETLKSINSSKKLSTMEFMTYIEQIQRWAAGMNIVIPDPNEQFNENNLQEH